MAASVATVQGVSPSPSPKQEKRPRVMAPNGRLTAKSFYDPLLLAIGQLVGFRPHQWAALDDVVQRVFELARIDVGMLPDGWQVEGLGGLRRRVTFAFRLQKEKPSERARGGQAMCVAGPGTGQYGLTEAGVARAMALDGARGGERPVAQEAPEEARGPSRGEVVLAAWSYEGEDEDLVVELVEVDDEDAQADEAQAAFGDRHEALASGDEWGDVETEPEDEGTRPARGRNATSELLARRLAGGRNSSLYRAVTAALSRKLRVSAAVGMIDDHAQEFFAKLIYRDALAKRIAAGQEIPDSLLASWAVRSGKSDARNLGTNPVARELYGARTDRERRPGAKPAIVLSTGDARDARAVWHRDDMGRATVADIAQGADLEQQVLDDLEFEAMWGVLEEVMSEKKPQAWRRYAGLIRQKAEGWTVLEIAKHNKVSRHRAASMLAEVRASLRTAVGDGDLDDIAAVFSRRLEGLAAAG